MTLTRRQKALFFLSLAAFGLVLLAVGLPEMRFQPGEPIPGADSQPAWVPALPSQPAPSRTLPFPLLVQGVLSLGFVLLLLIFIVSLLRRANLKRLAQLAVGLAFAVALLILIPRLQPGQPDAAPEEVIPDPPPAVDYALAPIGNPPAQLYVFVIGALALAVLLLAAWLLREALRKQVREDGLAREAGAALEAIEAGHDLRSVIIRAYLQMAEVLREEQGIERGLSVTPREFETLLAKKGIPDTPIHQLTHLFEQARYSSDAPGPEDERAAVECLSAIQSFCRGQS